MSLLGLRTHHANRVVAVLLLLGVPLFIAGFLAVLNGMYTRKWPRADAVIRQSGAPTIEPDMPGEPGHTHRTALVSADFSYEYAIGGAKFLGDGITPFSLVRLSSSSMQKLHRQYPAGAHVKVAYDPHNPTISYLEPGVSLAAKALFAAGSVMLSIAWLLRSLVRARIRGRSQIVRVNAGA